MGRIQVVLFALLLAATAAHAGGGREAVRDQIEASMLVTGRIHVDPQGRVERFEVDQDELPDPVNRLLAQAIPAWRFEPVLQDGQAAFVDTSMRIRVAATKSDEVEGAAVFRIAGASFGGWASSEEMAAEGGPARRNQPPGYPRDALYRGAMATVYLLGRVGLDGTMQEVIAEQVNLRYIGRERVMDEFREDFADASIRAAMKWTFPVPADVDLSRGYWSVRVPVDFTLTNVRQLGPGEWDSYIPGPRHTAWWEQDDTGAGDSYALGGVYPVGGGLTLLTPLDGNG